MWYHLILRDGDKELVSLKVTIDPGCTEPGVYFINKAAHMIEIFQILITMLTNR